MKFTIKHASLDEIKIMAAWAAAEGWNPGERDYLAYALIDAQGFYMGYLNDKPIACISTVKYPDNFGFLGFYIVAPEYRQHGYGYQIWQHAINDAQGFNLALDGVVAQQDNYKKSGFRLAHRNIRFVLSKNNIEKFSHPALMSTQATSLSAILHYDAAFFPSSRASLMTSWLSMYEGLVFQENNTIKGYGVIRPAVDGYRIGPLFADRLDIAKILFQGLCTKAPKDAAIYLDVPEINLHGLALVKKYNMQSVFETARMYTQHVPNISIERTFGLLSFEVG